MSDEEVKNEEQVFPDISEVAQDGGEAKPSDLGEDDNPDARDEEREHLDAEDDDDEGDEENDDNDEDDEDEDEDEEDEGPRRKRARRERRNQFLDVEAEVDEDEEDFEEDEEGLLREDGFIQEPEFEDVENDVDDRLHREVDRRREQIAEEDAERLASELRERYGRAQNKYRGDSGVVPQRLLLPSVNDPNIWGIRCRPGKEKELVRLILKKQQNLQYTKTPLEIFSVFQRDTFTGYIYIEARKQAAVQQALVGFTNVYPRNMVLVPIKEYPDMFRVNKSNETELIPGTYVRVKRGKYQGDLGIVENLSENGLEVRLKLVPRLDYGKGAALLDESNASPDQKRKRSAAANSIKGRPPQRLFSATEAMQHDQRNLQRRGPQSYMYLGEEYENGYLVKDFKITYLITEAVHPGLEELTKFNNSNDDGIDLTAVSQSLKQAAASTVFQTGDDVEVNSGEQAGMFGKVVSTQGSIVTIVGTGDILRGQNIDVPAINLRKRFSVGDHVRVMNGNYKDDTGMVVKVSKDNVTLLSDLSRTEITVFSKDLKAASDIGGANTIGQYELHDLVQLNSQMVGCIVKIERDSVEVLCQDGHLRTVNSNSITMRLTKSNNQFATDRNGQEVKIGDTVKETGGENRQGTILHIYRTFLFLHNREISENLGVFVSKIGSVTTVAVKGARGVVAGNLQSELERMNPAIKRNMPPPPVPTAFQSGKDKIIGQQVTIGKGSQYKGLSGTVKDSTDSVARIELEARNKIINVDKTKLLFNDARTGMKITYFQFIRPGSSGPPPSFSNNTNGNIPDHRGGVTPGWAAGSKTPAWSSSSSAAAAAGGGGGGGGGEGWGSNLGSKTPAWASSGDKTPAYNAAGAKTPAYGETWQSGSTPAWNAGSRTPAWNAGSRTPAWNSGARTPAFGWNSGSRTPGWDGNAQSSGRSAEAPTPGAFYGSSDFMNAPTPGFTPGAMGAPTPGVIRDDDISAPTPGVYDSARTPAAATAPTPGAWGGIMDTETPKYEPTTP